MLGSILMVLVPDILPMVSKELGKALFNAIMSQTWAVEQGEVTSGDCTLMADLVGSIALGQSECTMACLSMDLTGVEGGLLHLAHCMTDVLPKLTLREAVFLMLQQLGGHGCCCAFWQCPQVGLGR